MTFLSRKIWLNNFFVWLPMYYIGMATYVLLWYGYQCIIKVWLPMYYNGMAINTKIL